MGAKAICPKPKTSRPHPQHKVYPWLASPIFPGCVMVMFFKDQALKDLCAVCVRPGRILGISPGHGRSLKVNLMVSGSPNNNMQIYSLA
jgi:hypothetical protein